MKFRIYTEDSEGKIYPSVDLNVEELMDCLTCLDKFNLKLTKFEKIEE